VLAKKLPNTASHSAHTGQDCQNRKLISECSKYTKVTSDACRSHNLHTAYPETYKSRCPLMG